jgi:hypothetical protein
MRELNKTEDNSEYYSHNQTQRPLQEVYQNKANEDSNTVKQVNKVSIEFMFNLIDFKNKVFKTNLQVIKMLAIVVILFILCWSPILIIHVLTSFGILDPLNYGYLKPLRTGWLSFFYIMDKYLILKLYILDVKIIYFMIYISGTSVIVYQFMYKSGGVWLYVKEF